MNFEFALKGKNRDKRLDVLTLIDGVSLEKAKAIVEVFPLFKDLTNATGEDIINKKIPNVGQKTSQQIYSFFSIFRN